MRARGLILENVDGTQPEGPTNRFVLRAVPHTLSQGISITSPPGSQNPPADRTGWGGDGAPGQGRLADFTRQADILIAAAGVPAIVTGEMVRDGVIAVDVGINAVKDPSTGEVRIVGDLDFQSVGANDEFVVVRADALCDATRVM